jgi:hypothetical protein
MLRAGSPQTPRDQNLLRNIVKQSIARFEFRRSDSESVGCWEVVAEPSCHASLARSTTLLAARWFLVAIFGLTGLSRHIGESESSKRVDVGKNWELYIELATGGYQGSGVYCVMSICR